MRVPTSFLPKKRKDVKIDDLKKSKRIKKKIRNLKDLILEEQLDSSDLVCNEIGISTFKETYPFLNESDIVEGINVDYGGPLADWPIVDILEFKDEGILEQNLCNIIAGVYKFNHESRFSESYVLVKDMYAVFVYTWLGDYERRRKIIGGYKKIFGFKELKVD